jgi:hypothetical protein
MNWSINGEMGKNISLAEKCLAEKWSKTEGQAQYPRSNWEREMGKRQME